MTRLTRFNFVVLLVGVLAVTAGCESSSLVSPTAPGAASMPQVPGSGLPPSAVNSTDASIEGNVNATAGGSTLRALSEGITVSIVGTAIGSRVEASGYFKLEDVPSGDVELQFSGAGVDARLSIEAVRPQEHIEIAVVVSGSSASVETQQRVTTEGSIYLEGRIRSIDSSPSRIQVGDWIVSVSPETSIRRGSQTLSFSDLRVGDQVHVRGSKEGALFVAAQIEVEVVTSRPEPPPPVEVTLTGTVANLAGTCPSLTFTVEGTAVSTSASTTYGGDSACRDVKNGDKRGVAGTRQSDGRVLARYVSGAQSAPPPPPPVEVTLTGTVANLAGTCPSVTFTIEGIVVSTSASTTYGGDGACRDVKNGDRREVAGTKQNDGRILARYVSGALSAPPPPTTDVTLTGTVANLAGTCPSLAFTVEGIAVSTNTSTTYGGGGACSDIKNGDRRGIAGTKQNDGRVLARYISGQLPH